MEYQKLEQQKMDQAFFLFHKGRNFQAYSFLGAHKIESGSADSLWKFRVWAPHAKAVSVVGSFNRWQKGDCPMRKVSSGGIWEGQTRAKAGDIYAFFITAQDGRSFLKEDPYGRAFFPRHNGIAVLTEETEYRWGDNGWRERQEKKRLTSSPVHIYEVHVPSWRRDGERSPDFAWLRKKLLPYVKRMGYTHIEFLPLTEYPYSRSWGYQTTGYFALSARFGRAVELMKFVDACHEEGIGVILDWTPAHFPKDSWALGEYDGAPCYEPEEPKNASRKEWGTWRFDYAKGEVSSFLLSSAAYWLRQFHFDGIRVDALASMLFPDSYYGESEAAEEGESREAALFLRRLAQMVRSVFPWSILIAEDSSMKKRITGNPRESGWGFSCKWNMGWMNDTLRYWSLSEEGKKNGHDILPWTISYAFQENFLLPLSHDEVVYGKGSLFGKMPGKNQKEKLLEVRALLAYQIAYPGKKLTFMGNEFAQEGEWNFAGTLEWESCEQAERREMLEFSRDLNHYYLTQPALWQRDSSEDGFSWVACDDRSQSVYAFCRWGDEGAFLLIICNFQHAVRESYRIGAPKRGSYQAVFCSASSIYGGDGAPNRMCCQIKSEEIPMHGCLQSIAVFLPPMSVTFFEFREWEEGQRNQEGRIRN